MIGYVVILRADGRRAIQCQNCLRVSWHPKDVHYRYCGACHAFLDADWWPR